MLILLSNKLISKHRESKHPEVQESRRGHTAERDNTKTRADNKTRLGGNTPEQIRNNEIQEAELNIKQRTPRQETQRR